MTKKKAITNTKTTPPDENSPENGTEFGAVHASLVAEFNWQPLEL